MEPNERYTKALCLVGLYVAWKKRKVEKPKRKWWVRPLYEVSQRRQQGAHNNVICELRLFDPKKYTNWMRMNPFDKRLGIVGPSITKQFVVREPIDTGTKLELTLRCVKCVNLC